MISARQINNTDVPVRAILLSDNSLSLESLMRASVEERESLNTDRPQGVLSISAEGNSYGPELPTISQEEKTEELPIANPEKLKVSDRKLVESLRACSKEELIMKLVPLIHSHRSEVERRAFHDHPEEIDVIQRAADFMKAGTARMNHPGTVIGSPIFGNTILIDLALFGDNLTTLSHKLNIN